jgi:DNA-binding winged helix-turn-helix (wHTH) protein/TolB-like protein/Flp pilus assembly protein TadD
MDKHAPTVFVFEGYRLDLGRRRLTDPAGATLPLSGRAYDVLAYLVENRARVVDKDEIMRAVWPRVIVEENNLNQAIYNLRKALGDSRESPRFIVTVAGRGYQFIADVRLESAAAPAAAPADSRPADSDAAPVSSTSPPGDVAVVAASESKSLDGPSVPAHVGTPAAASFSRRWFLAAAAAAGVAGTAWLLRERAGTHGLPSSVAVLPFKPLIESDANAAIEFGITESLINRLGALPGVVVPPLSSVRRFAGTATDPLQAARELGVTAVLDGHLQIDRDRLRVTARLLEVSTGRALWSGQFNEHLDDFFVVQGSLAEQVVRALALELSTEQRDRLARRDTDDPEAWRLFLNGRYQNSLRTEESLRRALEFYEAAAQRDPAFALPHAAMADVLCVQGVFGLRQPQTVFPRAGLAAKRAIELDDQLAEAHAALGHIQVQYHRNWREGERLYRYSLALRPEQALGQLLLANCLMMQGRTEEALAEGRRAQSIEPADATYAANLGMLLMFARKLDQAHEQLSSLFAAAPDFPLVRHHLARLQVLRGQPDEAIRLLEGFAGNAPGSFSNLGRAYALAARVGEARGELARLQDLGAQGFGVGFDAALIHAALGERDAALSALETGLVDRSQTQLYLNVEPGFDGLRDEPRFRAVARQLGLA